MRVGPAGSTFDGITINETVTPVSNTCPADIPSLQSSAVWAGNSSFTVGPKGGDYDPVSQTPLPIQSNAFWDIHESVSGYSRLAGSEVQSCTIVCAQTYTCGVTPIANFQITRTFNQGTSGGYPATYVYATKQ